MTAVEGCCARMLCVSGVSGSIFHYMGFAGVSTADIEAASSVIP